ncbi:ceramidase domain-containing protein [Coralliovum pocilloporae]|uniref:ceramidase domain-containing protein n=1 Tax=Coralliovum pocilloporae TaxID=3066369 RepID=UPI0033077D26
MVFRYFMVVAALFISTGIALAGDHAHSWLAPVDLYCVRVEQSFWAEPLNALSNGAFLIAAVLAWRLVGRRGGGYVAYGFAALIGVIGLGSFLFHTFANRWSLLADVLPITLFIYGFFFVVLYRLLELPLLQAVFGTGAFLGASFVFASALPQGFLNGSSEYLPALAALLYLGALIRRRNAYAGYSLLTAALVFIVSITFRSIDNAICETLPIGIHYVWHILNGVVLYACVRALTGEPAQTSRVITS